MVFDFIFVELRVDNQKDIEILREPYAEESIVKYRDLRMILGTVSKNA